MGDWFLRWYIWFVLHLFFLFAKYFPTIAVAEIKYVLKTSGEYQKQDMDKVENQKVEDVVL